MFGVGSFPEAIMGTLKESLLVLRTPESIPGVLKRGSSKMNCSLGIVTEIELSNVMVKFPVKSFLDIVS